MTQSIDREAISRIVADFGAEPRYLVQILQTIVTRHGWIPKDTIRQLGRHVIKICQAEACQAMGSRTLTEHARQSLGTEMHGTAEGVTLEPVYCLGNCACAPAVMIDNKTHGRVDAGRFDTLVAGLREST